jgi:SAM-dependent methyltransferase
MTWEETIIYIRQQPAFKELLEKAYFEEDLPLNIERFRYSEEFFATLQLIQQYQPQGKKILDIGCGNGISSIAFALNGYQVTAVEPDSSQTIGAGAIRQLVQHYQLSNVEVFEAFAEDIQFPDQSYDIVYVRQAMHHAYDLDKFVVECARVLKKGGILVTIRDHVVFGEADKQWFLECHPLQKYYGGENAFSPTEYKNAMQKAGLDVLKELKHYDSVINYFPISSATFEAQIQDVRRHIFERRFAWASRIPFLFVLFCLYLDRKGNTNIFDEMSVAGRMYSYIAKKR